MKTHKPYSFLNALTMVLITTLSLTTCLLVNGDEVTSSTVEDAVGSPVTARVTELADGTGGPMSTPEPGESADGTGGPMSTPEPGESADGTGSPDAAMADDCAPDDSDEECNDMPESSD